MGGFRYCSFCGGQRGCVACPGERRKWQGKPLAQFESDIRNEERKRANDGYKALSEDEINAKIREQAELTNIKEQA